MMSSSERLYSSSSTDDVSLVLDLSSIEAESRALVEFDVPSSTRHKQRRRKQNSQQQRYRRPSDGDNISVVAGDNNYHDNAHVVCVTPRLVNSSVQCCINLQHIAGIEDTTEENRMTRRAVHCFQDGSEASSHRAKHLHPPELPLSRLSPKRSKVTMEVKKAYSVTSDDVAFIWEQQDGSKVLRRSRTRRRESSVARIAIPKLSWSQGVPHSHERIGYHAVTADRRAAGTAMDSKTTTHHLDNVNWLTKYGKGSSSNVNKRRTRSTKPTCTSKAGSRQRSRARSAHKSSTDSSCSSSNCNSNSNTSAGAGAKNYRFLRARYSAAIVADHYLSKTTNSNSNSSSSRSPVAPKNSTASARSLRSRRIPPVSCSLCPTRHYDFEPLLLGRLSL